MGGPSSGKPEKSQRPARTWVAPLVVILSCVALGGVIYYAGRPPDLVAQQAAVRGEPVDVREVLATLKIVTVEASGPVVATRRYEDWRGRVFVEIEVPVQFLYGVDLSQENLDVQYRDDSYLRVVVPPPRCLYTRYSTGRIRERKVEVWGAHTRKGAGQTQLTLCIYEDLPKAIERAGMAPERLKEVREQTRERLRALLQQIEPEKWIEVRFSDEEDRVEQSGSDAQPV